MVDEIGSMELLSERFRELLPRIFGARRLLATVHAKPDPVTDALKQRDDVHVLEVPGADPEQLAELVWSDVSATHI